MDSGPSKTLVFRSPILPESEAVKSMGINNRWERNLGNILGSRTRDPKPLTFHRPADPPQTTKINPEWLRNPLKWIPRTLDWITFWPWLQKSKINPWNLDFMTFWLWLQKSKESILRFADFDALLPEYSDLWTQEKWYSDLWTLEKFFSEFWTQEKWYSDLWTREKWYSDLWSF